MPASIAFTGICVVALTVWLLMTPRTPPTRGRQQPPGPARSRIVIYAGSLWALLSFAVLCYLGWGRGTSPQIDRHALYGIEHSGLYVAAKPGGETALVIRGKGTEGAEIQAEGFVHEALRPSEVIVLNPVWANGDPEIDEWRVTAKRTSVPLRIGGLCRNVPARQTLKSGDEVIVVIPRGPGDPGDERSYYAVRWLQRRRLLGRFTVRPEKFVYDQGVLRGGRKISDISSLVHGQPGMEVAKLSMVSFRDLSELLDRKKVKKRWREAGYGAAFAAIQPLGRDMASEITLVRMRRGDPDAELGVIVAPEFWTRGAQIRVNDEPLVELNQITTVVPGNEATQLAYMRSVRNRLALDLPTRYTYTEALGELLDIRFVSPPFWKLPPSTVASGTRSVEDFIITSSEAYIPRDGYLISTGNRRHPFYALAHVEDRYRRLAVSDGTPPASYESGEAFRLGDYDQGAIVTYRQRVAAIPYAGRRALLNLAIATFALWLLLTRGRAIGPDHRDVGWVALWGLTMALLVVRLVLAYRASLIPPLDATPLQLRSFHKSLHIAMNALLFVPGAMLAARWMCEPPQLVVGLYRRLGLQSSSARLIAGGAGRQVMEWVLALLPLLVATVARVTPPDPEVFPAGPFSIRASILVHVTAVAALMLLMRSLTAPPTSRYELWSTRIKALVLTIAPVGVLVFLNRDTGSGLYLLSLVPVTAVIWAWHAQPAEVTGPKRARRTRGTRRAPRRIAWQRPAGVAIVGVLLAASVALPQHFVRWRLDVPFVQRMPLPNNDVVLHRFVGFTGSQEAVLASDTALRQDDDWELLLRNSQQTWLMLAYASAGANEPRGYGGAPLTDVGMTYDTGLTDCVVAVYLMSEHGVIAAISVLLLYVGLAGVCLICAWRLHPLEQCRMVPLMAIGGFFACNGLYMAGANAGLLVFTGQNVPLLGLRSMADIFQTAALLAMAVWLMRSGMGEQRRRSAPERAHRGELELTAGLAFALLAFWFLWIVWGMAARLPESLMGHHKLSANTFNAMAARLEGPSPAIELKGNRTVTLEPRGFATGLTALEREHIDIFNSLPNEQKQRPGDCLYYVKPLRRSRGGSMEYRVYVNEHKFTIASPFRPNPMWTGSLRATAGEGPQPMVAKIGNPFSLSLASTGLPDTVALDDPRHVQCASRVRLVPTRGGNSFCELVRGSGSPEEERKLYAIPSASPGGEWEVYHNGERIDRVKPAQPRPKKVELAPCDILTYAGRGRGQERMRVSLVYQGFEAPHLAYVRWRNGEHRRVYADLTTYPMAKALVEAADTRATDLGTKNIDITIDLEFHRSLKGAIEKWADRFGSMFADDPLRSRRVAMTVLDVHSGEILAMPSWPPVNPEDPDFDELLDSAPLSLQARLVTNHNLADHIVGSAFKPIVFAALASAFRGEMDLTRLKAQAWEHPHREAGCIRFHPPYEIEEDPVGQWIPMDTFLVKSRSWPEVLIGFLGTVPNASDWKIVCTRPDPRADCQYNGRSYRLDLRRLGTRSAFTLGDQRDGGLAGIDQYMLPQALLFRHLPRFMSIPIDPDESVDALQIKQCQQFLPSLTFERDPYLPADVREVLPHKPPVWPQDFTAVRQHFVPFLLGGGEYGRFNNIVMAEAAARLATGRAVVATLEPRDPKDATCQTPLEPPLSDPRWRGQHIIEPLRQVGITGTGASLARITLGPYTALYKSGTLEEDDEAFGSEALMFVVGKRVKGEFVPGQAVAGFCYLEDAHRVGTRSYLKYGFARQVIPRIVAYLQENSVE